MADSTMAKLAVPGVVLLIATLSYTSQYLFYVIEPGPLDSRQAKIFNLLVICIWISYARACTIGPGSVPKGWSPDANTKKQTSSDENENEKYRARQRYCRKCNALKPPRSHHCKVCKRCIPKMDHHCPWTYNCVSHFTFPHFMRFLWYAVSAMAYLEYFLFLRAQVLWENRHLPSYLGPSVPQLISLFLLCLINSLTLFLVSVTFFRTAWGLGGNVTTIESWEIERHEQLLRRARVLGGYLDGPDGIRIKIVRQEFPYDVGIWSNIAQGMGSHNPLAWFWPFSTTPKTDGLSFEDNGFEDPGVSWPPPDPDRMPRANRFSNVIEDPFLVPNQESSQAEDILAFKKRQQADFESRADHYGVKRRRPFHERFEQGTVYPADNISQAKRNDESSGEEGWQDTGGNRLKDFGVDEDVEFYDEDNIPIAELLRRRKARP